MAEAAERLRHDALVPKVNRWRVQLLGPRHGRRGDNGQCASFRAALLDANPILAVPKFEERRDRVKGAAVSML